MSRPSRGLILGAGLGILGALAVSVVMHRGVRAESIQVEADLAAAENEVARLGEWVGRAENYKRTDRELEALLAIVEELNGPGAHPSRPLLSLAAVAPEEVVEVTDLSWSSRSAEVRVRAVSLDSVLELTRRLEAAREFSRVEISEHPTSAESRTYIVRADLEREPS